MRIGMLTQWFDPEPGPASLPGALARSLAARGHEVNVVTGFPNYPTGNVYPGYRQRWRTDEVVDDVSIRRVALFPSHDASVAGRVLNYSSFGATSLLWGASALRHCDAVWVSNSPITVAAPMWRLRHQYKLPIHLHVLDLWPDNVVSSNLIGSGRATRAVSRSLHGWTNWMYRTASHISTLSPGISEIVAKRGVEPSKLSVIPMWANEPPSRPDGMSFRRNKSVPDDRVTLLYGGALGRTQAIDSLIGALQNYPQDAPPVTAWIAGSGVEEANLRAMAGRIQRENVHLEFLGHVPSHEMPAVMAAADIHYVGLRDDPNSAITVPSKVQATLAAGRPMIIAVAGDAKAMVLKAEAGIAAQPDDPLSIASSIQQAAAMGRTALADLGKNGRVAYERSYSLDAATEKVEAVLDRVRGDHR